MLRDIDETSYHFLLLPSLFFSSQLLTEFLLLPVEREKGGFHSRERRIEDTSRIIKWRTSETTNSSLRTHLSYMSTTLRSVSLFRHFRAVYLV